MKSLKYILLSIIFSQPICAEENVSENPVFEPSELRSLENRADYLLKEDDGTVSYRGKYTIGEGGKVLRYDIYKESNKKLVQTDIPIYDSAGKLVMLKHYHTDRKLKMLTVIIGEGSTSLDPNGKVLSADEQSRLGDPRNRD